MWEDSSESNYKRLIRDAHSKPLVLFVGAGINANLLPSWGELLDSLMETAFYKIPIYSELSKEDNEKIKDFFHKKDHFTIYEQATLVKYLLADQYIPVLKKTLYSQCDDPDEFISKKPLSSIAKLCSHEYVHAVVTYNYDDLLEKAIESNGRKAYSVCGTIQHNSQSQNALPVFHVHGIIYSNHRIPPKDEALVVLTMDEYFQNMMKPFSWQTTSQLHFLQNYTCVYIGTSLSDFNMQRMLGYAKNHVKNDSIYIMTCEKSLIGDEELSGEVTDFLFQSFASILENLGVRMVYTGKDYASINTAIEQLEEALPKRR